jgi:hypothetical protein
VRALVFARERVVERTALVALVAGEPDARSAYPPRVTVRLLPGAPPASDEAETYARAARPPRAPLIDVYA